MHTHIQTVLLTYRHYGIEEILHIFLQLLPVYPFIFCKKRFESGNRCEISFLDVTVDKTLGLDDDGIDEIILFSFCYRLVKLLDLRQHFRRIVRSCTLPAKYLQVKIGKTSHIEIK